MVDKYLKRTSRPLTQVNKKQQHRRI